MATVSDRITEYLSTGGLFNPELADHTAVRKLLIDCLEELQSLRAERDRLQTDVAAWAKSAPAVVKEAFTGNINAINALRDLQNECFQLPGRYDGAMDEECKHRMRAQSAAFAAMQEGFRS